MKLQICTLFTCLALAIGLASCGKSDEGEAKFEVPPPEEKPPKTKRTVRANETAKKAALDRLAVMQEITTVLKPLRDPAAALDKEAQLKTLFDQYFQHTEIAAAEGINGRLLAALTAHLAPDDWGDARGEFHMYILLVGQLGEPQRQMMKRLMREGEPASAEKEVEPEPDGASGE